MSIAAIIAGLIVNAMFLSVPGAIILWIASVVLEALWKSKDDAKPDAEEPEETCVLKTTDAGPYTAPGLAWLPPGKADAPADRLPILSNTYACLISYCTLMATGITFVATQAFAAYTASEWIVFPGSSIVALFAALLMSFVAVSGIHALMIPLTFLRSTILTLIVFVIWISVAAALIAMCHLR